MADLDVARAAEIAKVLREWNALKDEGVITETEWKAMKAKMLSQAIHARVDPEDAAMDAEHLLFLHRAKQGYSPPAAAARVSDDEASASESDFDEEEERAARTWATKQIEVRVPQIPAARTSARPPEFRDLAPPPETPPPVVVTPPKKVLLAPIEQTRRRKRVRNRWPASPPRDDRPRSFTRGEREMRELTSLGLSSKSTGALCWNSSVNAASNVAVPSSFRRPWQAEGEAPALPARLASPPRAEASPPRREPYCAPRPPPRPVGGAPPRSPPWSPIDLVGRNFSDRGAPPLVGRFGVTPEYRRRRRRDEDGSPAFFRS